MTRLTKGLCLLMSSIYLFAGDELIHWDRFDRDELKSQAFEVSSTQTFNLETVGPNLGRHASYVWILDLKTRQPVWELDDAMSRRFDGTRRLRRYEDEFTLKKGYYQLFYSSTQNRWGGGDFNFRLKDLFDWKDYKPFKRSDLRDFDLRIWGEAELIQNTDRFLEQRDKQTLVSVNKIERDTFEQIGLKVQHDTDIYIYGIGEITRDGNYDSAYIKDLKSGKKVWVMDHFETDYAGGGEKNRMFRDYISLDEGNYVLTVFSDDSHHYDHWNVTPPFDPDAWGVTLYVKDLDDVQTFDFQDQQQENLIVSLTELGDDEYVSKGFTLNQGSDVRIVAMGEGHDRHDLADYGWIMNMDTNRKIWDMNDRRTEHAGGSKKNRMVDEVVHLDPGSYKVYFVTDDSHSYRDDFNASKPHEAWKWGITVSGAAGFKRDMLSDFVDLDEQDALVRIIRMRDHERESESFYLDEDSDVRIYAVGEGFRDDMADYGWILDAETGRTVWRMSYENSEHAGGSKKNRVVDQVIHLKAGRYKVVYETDGSHSFKDWNSRPPRDQENWGISVYKMD